MSTLEKVTFSEWTLIATPAGELAQCVADDGARGEALPIRA